MCGNEAIIIDEHDSDNNEKKQQEVEAPNISNNSFEKNLNCKEF
jgi:hypothetical protein